MATSSGAIRAGRAFVELLTDDSKLVRGLRSAAAKLKGWGASISGFGKKLAGIGSAVAGPMIAATTTWASAGHEMALMSARTGIGVEALSQLSYAAKKCGLDNETLETGIKRMQKTLYAAANGSQEARDALAAVGLTIEDINGLPVEEKLKAIADRIAAIGSPTKRAGAAMAIFGPTARPCCRCWLRGPTASIT